MKRGLQIVTMALMSLVMGAGLLPAQSWGNRDANGNSAHYQYRNDRAHAGDRNAYRGSDYRDSGYRGGYDRRDHRIGRTVAIVGGGAAAGAAIGALGGGGKGAAIGALIGGASGLVIDQVARHHHRD